MSNHNWLEHARAYHARGWSVIGIGKGKKPPAKAKWKQYQTRLPTEAEIETMFTDERVTGVAVILGPVSGDLSCRDFDNEGEYEKWKQNHPELAVRLPTVRTNRGYHVYAICPGARFKGLDDAGEFRTGGRHYTVLPPSLHPEGTTYEWVVPLGESIPVVDPVEAGLVPNNGGPDEAGKSFAKVGQSLSNPVTHSHNILHMSGEDSLFLGLPEAQHAIAESIPSGYRQRNNAVFHFARRLKAIPAVADQPVEVLKPIVVEWHRCSLDRIRTKAFYRTWKDFEVAWPRVKVPWGRARLAEVLEVARASVSPACSLWYERSEVQLLVKICRELQRRARTGAFFLPVRVAGDLIGVSHTTAHEFLKMLCADGILLLVNVGNHAEGKANEYRYVVDASAEAAD